SRILSRPQTSGISCAIHRCSAEVRRQSRKSRTEGTNAMKSAELQILSTVARAGRFGPYGGRYVPETLMAALEELEAAYEAVKQDQEFQSEFERLLRQYAGRPTPLSYAARLTEKLGG